MDTRYPYPDNYTFRVTVTNLWIQCYKISDFPCRVLVELNRKDGRVADNGREDGHQLQLHLEHKRRIDSVMVMVRRIGRRRRPTGLKLDIYVCEAPRSIDRRHV
jgi:hypothetical protein